MRIDEDTLSSPPPFSWIIFLFLAILNTFVFISHHQMLDDIMLSMTKSTRIVSIFTHRIQFIRFQTILCATKILNQFYSISSLLSHFHDLHFIGCLSREWSRERDWETEMTTTSKYDDISAMKRENSMCHLNWVCELFWMSVGPTSNVYGCPFPILFIAAQATG